MSLINWQSPLGVVVIVIFATSVILYGIGIFKRELGFYEKKVMLDQRQEYIPLFRQVVDKMLTRMKELAVEAGKLPLEQYYNKYLKLNNTYKREYLKLSFSHKDEKVRCKVAIVAALGKKGFGRKNSYLYELEDKDTSMDALKKEYAIFLARANDNPLSKSLKRLFKQAMVMYSGYSIAEIAKNNDFPFKDPKYINVTYEKPKILESFVNIFHKWVNERFDALLRGDDL